MVSMYWRYRYHLGSRRLFLQNSYNKWHNLFHFFLFLHSSICLFFRRILFTNIPSFLNWVFVLKTRFELLKWILWKVSYFQFCVALAILEVASNAWPFGNKYSTFQIYYLVSFLCPLNMMTSKPVWRYWDFVVISQGFPWQEGLFNLHINVLM